MCSSDSFLAFAFLYFFGSAEFVSEEAGFVSDECFFHDVNPDSLDVFGVFAGFRVAIFPMT